MGLEAACKARLGARSGSGKALLETENLLFRGEFRLSIPLKDVQSAVAVNGELRVKTAGGVAVFELGSQAEKWVSKIRNPRSRIDKLGVKPGMRVAVIGAASPDFRAELGLRTEDIATGKPRQETDVIFLMAEEKPALARLRSLESALKPNGAIWVVYPKGQKHITESDVLQCGRDSGLVDIKVASFSETHTALKFVIPVAKR